MAGLRYDFRQEIERTRLVIDRVELAKMAHARAIFVKIDPSGVSGTTRGEAEAQALMANIQDQLKAGKSFDELAGKYSEVGDKGKAGDLGILYEGMRGMDTAILNSALAMTNGQASSEPGKTRDGYFLLRIISTSDNHPGDEDAAYRDASLAYREAKARMLAPEAIVGLIKKSKVVYYVHS